METYSHANSVQPVLWTVGVILLLALALLGAWQCRVLSVLADASAVGVVPLSRAQTAVLAPPPQTDVLPAPQLLQPAALVQVDQDDGVVGFYFTGEQVQLPPDAANALGLIVRGVAAGQTAVIRSHASTDSDPARTAQRVLAVHNLLVSVGIGEDKIQREQLHDAAPWAEASDTDRVDVLLTETQS